MSRLLVPLAVFFSAAASLGVELAIVRLGAPYVGQSLLPWSAAIASVLLGLTAGHVLGGIAGAAAATLPQARVKLAAAWLLAGLAAAAMPLTLHAVTDAMPAGQGFGTGAVLAIAALACPPSLAAGFVAPLAVRMAVLMPDLRLPRMVGSIYAASAAGSVLGTAAAGFVLLERIGASGLASVVAGVWIALGIAVLPWRSFSARQAAGGAAAAAAAVLAVFLLAAPGPCLLESRYTCIRLFDQDLDDGNVLRFMILDEGVHSATDRDDPRRLHLGYAALADRLARAAFARADAPRALVIGGGGATLPRAWAAAPAQAVVTSVELDPAVVAVADEAMWAAGHAALTTVVGDGRAVVRALPPDETFAVVLMDAYRTHSVPPHLVTREFGEMIAARMTARGVFLSNVIDRIGTPLLALSIATTLAQIFPAVDVWASEGGSETTNYVVAAWKDPAAAHRPDFESVRASVMEAGEAVRARDVIWRRVDSVTAGRAWPQACVAVLTDDRAPVDRLLAGRALPHCETPGSSRKQAAREAPGPGVAVPANRGL